MTTPCERRFGRSSRGLPRHQRYGITVKGEIKGDIRLFLLNGFRCGRRGACQERHGVWSACATTLSIKGYLTEEGNYDKRLRRSTAALRYERNPGSRDRVSSGARY